MVFTVQGIRSNVRSRSRVALVLGGCFFFFSFVGKKGKRGFLEYLCIKIWVGIKRTSYHLCKYLFSVNKWVTLLLWGEMSLPRNSLEESGCVSYVQPWFRSACNRKGSQSSRLRSSWTFTGFWSGSSGRFPGRGSSVSQGREAYKLLLNLYWEVKEGKLVYA